MTDFKVGDKVKVTLEGELVQSTGLISGGENYWEVKINANSPVPESSLVKTTPPMPTRAGTVLYEYDDKGTFITTVVRIYSVTTENYWIAAESGVQIEDKLVQEYWDKDRLSLDKPAEA